MLEVHHGDAFTQFIQRLERAGLGFLTAAFAPPPLRDAVAKQLRLAHQGRLPRPEVEAAVQRRGGDRKVQPGGDKLVPVANHGRIQLVFPQRLKQDLTAPGRLGAQQHRPLMLREKTYQVRGG